MQHLCTALHAIYSTCYMIFIYAIKHSSLHLIIICNDLFDTYIYIYIVLLLFVVAVVVLVCYFYKIYFYDIFISFYINTITIILIITIIDTDI